MLECNQQIYNFTGELQFFTVPAGVTSVVIQATGARGGATSGGGSPGFGAFISGSFAVTPGEMLTVLVGGAGENINNPVRSGGGGGGSFVWRGVGAASLANIMVAAGGGGGGGCSGVSGISASLGTSGTASNGNPPGAGGVNGLGGLAGAPSNQGSGGGGGGLIGSGQTASNISGVGGAAISLGGAFGSGAQGGGDGGFGGGGGGAQGGGGGGGFSGGGGAGSLLGCGGGGGGGSFNGGSNFINILNRGTGNGSVVIRYLICEDIVTGSDPNLCGAVVNYPGANNCTGVTITCNPSSGFFFPVGTTTVTCTASTSDGVIGTCSFDVTVNDNQSPTIFCPDDIIQSNDEGLCGAVVEFEAGISENCPGVTVECDPPSGFFFPVGTTTVTCTATDTAGNTATCSFTVTVVDTEPPQIICPEDDSTISAPGQCGSIVFFETPAVTDNCTENVIVECDPPSGSFFPVGTTTVTCTATDAAGNTATCSFDITVFDVEPPTVDCPDDMTITIPAGQPGTTVNFTATVDDNCPGATVACVPPSGSFFPVGTTAVICTGTDASGNTATCTFDITVVNEQPGRGLDIQKVIKAFGSI